MIFDLPEEIQMAIRLKAAKSHATNAAVVSSAIDLAFPQEVKEAKKVLEDK